MTDRRRLNPKAGQHLGKRILNPKKRKKGTAPRPTRPQDPLAEWERELLGLNDPQRRRVFRRP